MSWSKFENIIAKFLGKSTYYTSSSIIAGQAICPDCEGLWWGLADVQVTNPLEGLVQFSDVKALKLGLT